jgi:hypothetical protein
MEDKKVGKFEKLYPFLYAGRIDCQFNVYELSMLKNSLIVDQQQCQKLIDNCTDDIKKYDLLEMKLKRFELESRVSNMIKAITVT